MNKEIVLSIKDLQDMIQFIKDTRIPPEKDIDDSACGIFQFKDIDIIGREIGSNEYQDVRTYIYKKYNK